MTYKYFLPVYVTCQLEIDSMTAFSFLSEQTLFRFLQFQPVKPLKARGRVLTVNEMWPSQNGDRF